MVFVMDTFLQGRQLTRYLGQGIIGLLSFNILMLMLGLVSPVRYLQVSGSCQLCPLSEWLFKHLFSSVGFGFCGRDDE